MASSETICSTHRHNVNPGICFLQAVPPAQDTLSALFDRLVNGEDTQSVIYALKGRPKDSRILQALRAAFDDGKTAEQKQWIAATFLRLGNESDKYLDFLASRARVAVEDRALSF